MPVDCSIDMNRELYIGGNIDAQFRQWLIRASAWGAVLFLMLSALDYFVARGYFTRFLAYRVIISFLLLAISAVAARSANRLVHLLLAYAAIGGSAATIEIMILQIGGHASSYYVGMILLCVAAPGLLPARFSFYAASVVLIYCVYLLPIVMTERITNREAFFTSNAFMVMIFSTVLLMRYLNGVSLAKELGLRYDLEQSKERLEDAVQARTRELSQVVLRLQQEIVDHERTEKQLHRYSRDLKDRNDELRSFVYSISHDLRTPLVNLKGFSAELGGSLRHISAFLDSGITGFAGKERTRLQHVVQEEIPAALGFINASSDKIHALINAFLKLSRIGNRTLSFEPIDMTGLVRSLVESQAGAIARKGITVAIDALPQITADRNALEQVVGSIVDNAIKYTEAGSGGILEVRGERKDSETLFHFRDNGRGIAPDDVSRVFDLFSRLGPQDGSGEGMGLAYAKALVRRHGGRIWCDTTLGTGTTFSFSISHDLRSTPASGDTAGGLPMPPP